MDTDYKRRSNASRTSLPDYDFPRSGNYRCMCCDSRNGPFYDDRTGKKGLDFLCSSCHNEVVEVRQMWNISDEYEGRSL